jgi:O-antigen/teichoic acid export membrane protein
MFFGFLVGIQLARSLGPTGYGVYGLAMSIIAALTIPTEFGFPKLATREIASSQVHQQWGKIRKLLNWFTRTILSLSLLLIPAAFGTLWLATEDLAGAFPTTLLIGLLLIPAVALLHLYSAALRGLQYLVIGQIPDTLLRPAFHSMLLFVVLWLPGYSLSPFVAMLLGVVATVLGLMVAAMLLRARLPITALESASFYERQLWREALPMAMTEGMRMLQGHVVIFTLGLFAVAAVVGQFKVASAIMMLVSMPITLLNVISAPVISRLHQQNDVARLQRLLSSLALAMTLACGALALLFLLSGKALVIRTFGDVYQPSVIIVNILILGIMGNCLFGASAGLLNMTGNAERVSRASLLAVMVLILSCLVLVPDFGAIGGAISASGSLILWHVMMWRDAKRILGLNTAIWARGQ